MPDLTVDQIREMRYEPGFGWVAVNIGVYPVLMDVEGVDRYVTVCSPMPILEGVAAVLGEYLTSYSTWQGNVPSPERIKQLMSDPRLKIELA